MRKWPITQVSHIAPRQPSPLPWSQVDRFPEPPPTPRTMSSTPFLSRENFNLELTIAQDRPYHVAGDVQRIAVVIVVRYDGAVIPRRPSREASARHCTFRPWLISIGSPCGLGDEAQGRNDGSGRRAELEWLLFLSTIPGY